MHKFLRAVGFSEIKKEELNIIFEKILEEPSFQKMTKDSEGNEFAELTKEFGDFSGLSLRGTYDENDIFHMDYYYPYFCGTTISTHEKPEVEKHRHAAGIAEAFDDAVDFFSGENGIFHGERSFRTDNAAKARFCLNGAFLHQKRRKWPVNCFIL